MNPYYQRIRELIAVALQLDATTIHRDSSMLNTSAWNSLGQLTILTLVQEEFNLEFTLDEMLELESVSSICELVERLLSK